MTVTSSEDEAGRKPELTGPEQSAATAPGVTPADDVVTPAVVATPAAEPPPAAAASSPATPAPAAPPPRRGGGFATLVALLALVVAAAALVAVIRPGLLRHVSIVVPAPSLAPLDRRMAALEARPALDADLKALGEQVATLAANIERTASLVDTDLPAKLAAIEEQIVAIATEAATATHLAQTVEQSQTAAEAERSELAEALSTTTDMVAQSAPAADLAALDERVTSLEGVESTTAASHAMALALSATGVRRAIAEGSSIAQPLALARKYAGDDAATAAALATLDTAAGAPTMAMLQGELAAIANAVHEAQRNTAMPTWADRALTRLDDLVSPRRNAATGPSADAVLARARAYLATGDIAGADATLARYVGPGADAVRAWRDRAGSRSAVIAAAASLEARAYERLAGAL